MEDQYLIMLSVLYGAAGISLASGKFMNRCITIFLSTPLFALCFFYASSLFWTVDHWIVALAQSSYLIAIILVAIFTAKDRRRERTD
jgi:hypothetical protein